MIERLIAAYRRSASNDFYGADSMWRAIRHEKQRDLHDLLLAGNVDAVDTAIRNVRTNYFLYGIESLYKEWYERRRDDIHRQRKFARRVKGELVRLAEALGVAHIENPEGGAWLQNIHLPTDALVKAIEGVLRFRLVPAWIFDGMFGLGCASGVLGDRMVHAAYCAYRVLQLARGPVLEIGAGVGYVANYAAQMAIPYTVVDLPMTNVVQGYFLMRCLGEDAVSLDGEPASAGQIRIRTPAHMDERERYDLVLNVDSLTELGAETATSYLKRIFDVSNTFLSINHEANPITVGGLVGECLPDVVASRFPYWMRRGYVEEIFMRRDHATTRADQ